MRTSKLHCLTPLRLAAVFLLALIGETAGADSFTVPGTVAAQAVFSCGDMSISGGGTIDSAGIAASGPANKGTVRSNGKITDSSSTISGGSTITLGGAVRILVTGNVSISGGSFVNSSAYSFRFWHSGTTFSLSSSTFTGIVYAPSASLTISSSRLIGTVFADAVSISGGTSHVTRSIDHVVPSVSITAPANGAGVSHASAVGIRGTVADRPTDVTVTGNRQP